MLSKVFRFIAILLVAGLLSCGDSCSPVNMPVSTHHNSERTHDYAENDGQAAAYRESRDIWQRPGVVIEKLGDLEGKTVADIGAAYGYFSLRLANQTSVKKVIAVDIDEEALAFMNQMNSDFIPEERKEILQTRLADTDDPKLEEDEVDIVMIVNTIYYLPNRVKYFQNLRRALVPGGRLVIVDYKKKKAPFVPPLEMQIAQGQVEKELQQAGYQIAESDDQTLGYQYIITALNPS